MSPERALRRAPVALIVSPNEADAEVALSFLRENGVEARASASLLQAAGALDESCGCLVIVATHDKTTADMAGRIIRIKDGLLEG